MARKSAQQRRVEQLVAQQQTLIANAFREAMARAGNTIDRAELIRLLETGQLERAAQLFRIDRGLIYPLEEAIRSAYIAGGLSVAQDLPKGLSGVFGFQGSHPRALTWAQEMAANLITYTSDENIAAARRVISHGIETNRSLNSVARDLAGRVVGRQRVGGIVGLTEPQTSRMINIRSMLSNPDRIGEYFNGSNPRYVESDRRHDRMIRKAIREGRALSAADVERVTDAYKSKATGARAKRIARNEAFTSQAAGRAEGFQQLLDDGKVSAVTVRWQHNLSVNAREDHVAMDGTTINLGETFNFPDGARMEYPHDPAGGVEHSAGCRCIAVHRVKL